MVTLTKIGRCYNSRILRITGLSTDVKPIGFIDGIAIINGSTFREIDTGTVYLYNAESSEWVKNTSSSSVTDGLSIATDEEVAEMLTEVFDN